MILKNQNDNCMCYISAAKMMQCKYYIYINRKFDMKTLDKCWYQRKGTWQSSNYGSYSSPQIYTFDSCQDNDEDNFDIFDIHNNNKTVAGCTFDDNLGNLDQSDDIVEIICICQTIESTETLSNKSFS